MEPPERLLRLDLRLVCDLRDFCDRVDLYVADRFSLSLPVIS